MSFLNTKSRSLLFTLIIASILCVASMALGYYLEKHIPKAVLIPTLKFFIGIIGVVWLFSLNVYNKLSDVTDFAGLDYRQHRNIEFEIKNRLSVFWLRAIFLGLLGFCMYIPTILNEAKLPIAAWVFGISIAALSLAFLMLQKLLAELEEIRELKSYIKEIERREKERSEQVKTLKESLKDAWVSDSNLDGFRKK